MDGTRSVRESKTLFTPHPFDQRDAMTPAAPPSWSRLPNVPVPSPTLYPVASMRALQRRVAESRDARIRAKDAESPNSRQLSSGRQVGCAIDTSTNFPRACGSHLTSSALSRTSGRMIVPPVTSRPPVPALHASNVPSSERTRGVRRSTCVVPRRHPLHFPYSSFFASTPQLLYVATSQSLPRFIPGVPVRRGPIESLSTCESRYVCELFIPSAQICRMMGSAVVYVCAGDADAATATSSAAADRERFMMWIAGVLSVCASLSLRTGCHSERSRVAAQSRNRRGAGSGVPLSGRLRFLDYAPSALRSE